MKNYERPIVMINEDLAEGVYAHSGLTGTTCYKVIVKEIKQEMQDGRMNYCIQFDAEHTASHHGHRQHLVITFDRNVEWVSGGTLCSGDNTKTLVIDYSYHQNYTDKIGNGALYVYTSDATLAVVSAIMECNEECFDCNL